MYVFIVLTFVITYIVKKAIAYMERALMSPLPSSNPSSPQGYRMSRASVVEKDLISEVIHSILFTISNYFNFS